MKKSSQMPTSNDIGNIKLYVLTQIISDELYFGHLLAMGPFS
jgi:hypothetical protein